MIAHLEGLLREARPTRVVVDVSGVGYEVFVPLSTFAELPDEGKTVALHVYTHARDGAIQLFGFATASERAAFDLLLCANRVGPKLAQTILSSVTPAGLLDAIRAGEVSVLRAAPGVGTKLAERILLELRDRTADLAAALAASGERPGTGRAGESADLLHDQSLSALLNLGYPKSQAERALALARAESDDADDTTLEVLVRRSLRNLL